MITNERQYKITRAGAARFEKALAEFDANAKARIDTHPRLLQAERDALKGQRDELQAEVNEYEHLKSGKQSIITIDSFDGLAEALIKARIATGLSQKDLAIRLGLKEQQIQRYEAERYSSASLQRLQDIARAIGVRIEKNLLLPIKATTSKELIAKLNQVGIDREFLFSRLLPSVDAVRLKEDLEDGDSDDIDIAKVVIPSLTRVFGWAPTELFNELPLRTPEPASAYARFKMPANRSRHTVYVSYVHHLAVSVLSGSSRLPTHSVPTNPLTVRGMIIRQYGQLTLINVLHYVWDLGIPVLPLSDHGKFHGACWRYERRNVIVLKQSAKYESRWIFDLLHELYHAGEDPDASTFEVIESDETSSERRNSDQEIAASLFAGNVLLDDRAEALAEACVSLAKGSVEKLKTAVRRVAEREGIGVGVLANYLAFRLSWQNINWWGAASNLQESDGDPFEIAKQVFLERFPFEIQNDLDRKLIERALQ